MASNFKWIISSYVRGLEEEFVGDGAVTPNIDHTFLLLDATPGVSKDGKEMFSTSFPNGSLRSMIRAYN